MFRYQKTDLKVGFATGSPKAAPISEKIGKRPSQASGSAPPPTTV